LDLSSKIIEYVKGIGIIKAFGKDENTVKRIE
jgi:ABC transporter, ATP-binding protein